MAVAAFFGVFDQMLPVFQGQMAEGLQEGFTIQLVFSALSSDVVLLVLPILSALVFTSAFVDDYTSRYIREYLPRAGRKNYVRARVFSTALSGGLTLFIGVMLVLLVFAILFLPLEVPPEQPELSEYERQMQMMMGDTANETDTAAQQNFATLMQHAFLFFLSGCLWSLVGGLMATVTMSRYMAYASPFILYYVLVILSERYFTTTYILNPREWLNPTGGWVGGIWGAALFVAELTVIAGFVYSYAMERRLRDA